MITPVTTKNLGINSVTGLEEILKVWEVNINSKIELIRVVYEIVTLSPTGIVVASSGNLEYTRYNSSTNPAFDNWRNSSIGAGITAAIDTTLAKYPNIDQEA